MKKEIVGVRVKTVAEMKKLVGVELKGGGGSGWADYIVSGMIKDMGQTFYGEVKLSNKKNNNGSQRVTFEGGKGWGWDERWLDYIYATDVTDADFINPDSLIIGYRIKSKEQMEKILGIPKDTGNCVIPNPGWNKTMWSTCGSFIEKLDKLGLHSYYYYINPWSYSSNWLEVLYIEKPVVVVEPVVVVKEVKTQTFELRGDQFVAVSEVTGAIEGTSVKVTKVCVSPLDEIVNHINNFADDELTPSIVDLCGTRVDFTKDMIEELIRDSDVLVGNGDLIPAEWLTITFEVTSRVNL